MGKKSFKSAINDKTSIMEKSGIGALMTSTENNPSVAKASPVILDSDSLELRQSFIIKADYFEKLRDYVYMVKTTSDPFFSQKDALHLALDLLFEKAGKISSRPERIKQMENRRSNSLKRKK